MHFLRSPALSPWSQDLRGEQVGQPHSEPGRWACSVAASGASEYLLLTQLYVLLENKTLNHLQTALAGEALKMSNSQLGNHILLTTHTEIHLKVYRPQPASLVYCNENTSALWMSQGARS